MNPDDRIFDKDELDGIKLNQNLEEALRDDMDDGVIEQINM